MKGMQSVAILMCGVFFSPANKGFVQSSILTKPSCSLTGSLSSLTANDSDNIAASLDEGDAKCSISNVFFFSPANKGFVQSSILTKPSSSPTGSLSSLTADDSDDVAASLDEGDALPWLATQSASPYPDMTDVSQTDGSSSSLLSSSSGQPPFEVCFGEAVVGSGRKWWWRWWWWLLQ